MPAFDTIVVSLTPSFSRIFGSAYSVEARVAMPSSRCRPSTFASSGLVSRRRYPNRLKLARRDDSPTASTTTRLPGVVTRAWMSMDAWSLRQYGRSAFVVALTDPEMTLMGTSEYTMYLLEALPARKM